MSKRLFKEQRVPVLEHPAGQEHAKTMVEHHTIKDKIKALRKELKKTKAEDDSTLTYRRSCREGICGSCAMNIDGTNTVACLKPIDPDTSKPTTITPLPHMFVIKDLVVDFSNFYHQYKLIEPWLKPERPLRMAKNTGKHPNRERDEKGYTSTYILCACCTTSCPSYWWNPEEFFGPATLLQVYRWICDSRDDFANEQLQALMEDHRRLYRFRNIQNCTNTCPKSLNTASAIHKLKAKHLLSLPVKKG
ncbi:hypothetical protein ACSBR2_009088 [Camellia fascicularis]